MKNYSFTISKKAEILSDTSCIKYIEELKKRKKYIHDINVTCKMVPFINDAHGILMSAENNRAHIEQMLYVQEQTGINISLVFNNIYVPNDLDNLKIFLQNFKKYYEMNVRNITLPHILWMKTGEIQREYPELYIKSTVLRRVRNGQEFWNFALAGFNCVNVDRLLFRNLNTLREIKNAQKNFYECYGRYVDISMVIDENCIGNCPFWEEHYQHSMTSKICSSEVTNVEGFNLVPTYSGCRDFENVCLRRVNLIAFKDDMNKVFENIDLIKIGGRRFNVDTFKIMDTVMDSQLICHPLLHKILVRGEKKEVELLEEWRRRTKNCEYQCWKCDLCNQLDKIIFKGRVQEWKRKLFETIL